MAEQEPAADALAAYRRPFLEAWERLAVAIARDFGDDHPQARRTLERLDKELKTMHNEQMSGMKAEQVYQDDQKKPGRTLLELGHDFNRSSAQMHSDLRRAKQRRETTGEE